MNDPEATCIVDPGADPIAPEWRLVGNRSRKQWESDVLQKWGPVLRGKSPGTRIVGNRCLVWEKVKTGEDLWQSPEQSLISTTALLMIHDDFEEIMPLNGHPDEPF